MPWTQVGNIRGPAAPTIPLTPEIFDAMIDQPINAQISPPASTSTQSGHAYTFTGQLPIYNAIETNGGAVLPMMVGPNLVGAWYSILRGANATMLCGSAEFVWLEGSTNGGVGAIGVIDDPANIGGSLNAALHITVSPTTIAVGVFESGTLRFLKATERPNLGGNNLIRPTAIDGQTSYRVAFLIDPVAGTAVVYAPDGEVLHFSDPAIKHVCPYIFYEGVQAATTDNQIGIVKLWADSTKYIDPRLDTGTASKGAAGAAGSNGSAGPGAITFGYSGSLGTYVGSQRWYNDTGRTLAISSCRASVGTAPTGSSVIVDVDKNGTSIFTTQANRPTLAAGALTSGKATPDVTTLADGDYLTVDIDQIGSTLTGADLVVQVTVS